MTYIAPTQAANASQNTASAGKASTVDYETFLRLLVTQMKNQDPTKPMESTEYVAQLATFSQVEQSIQTNNKLDQMMQMTLLGQADSVIGRTVTSADGAVSGTVKEVMIGTGALVAILEDGSRFLIEPGVTVS